jgi:hypothetical protein
MKLTFVNASNFNQNLKCTIHKSGKLGFSEAAISKLDFSNNRYVKIATNDDDENDKNLYLQVQQTSDEYCFAANKAGRYYYINTKTFFDNIGVDYRNQTVIFDIVEIEFEGQKLFKLIRREKRRK